MEPVADPPAPLHGRPELKPAERIELELEVLSTSDPAPSPIAAELHTDVAAHAEGPEANDAGTPPPLGIKLTGYRLLNIIVLIAVGLAKFILSLKGHSATPTGLEWMAGSILAAILYWLGLYEAIEPPKWFWFLHTDYAPAIVYSCKYLLSGVMRARALYWEVHPFYLPVGTPVPVRTRAPSHPVAFSTRNTSITLLSRSLSWSLCAILILIFTKRWRIWKPMWVWCPIKWLFHKYGANYPTPGQYRLFSKAGFMSSLLSGLVLLGPVPFLLCLRFFAQKGRAVQDTSP